MATLRLVSGAGGLQNAAGAGSVQKAAGARVVQNAAPVRVVQPAVGARVVQKAAPAVNAAAEAQRLAVLAAAEAQRRAVELQLQRKAAATAQLNLATGAVKHSLTSVIASTIRPRLQLLKRAMSPKLAGVVDNRTDEERLADQLKFSYDRYNSIKSGAKKTGWLKLWDKVTFGQDKRDVSARQFADRDRERISRDVVDGYNKNLKAFLSEQARRKQVVESSKFGTDAEAARALDDYNKWQVVQVASLKKRGLALEKYQKDFDSRASAQLTSKAARGVGAVVKFAQNQPILSKVWKYTLGEGSKNLPSLVTAPARAVNYFGNLNTKDRTIYRSDGTSSNRFQSKDNAWQSTFNQRNFNIRPWTDITPGKRADLILGSQVRSLIAARKQLGEKDPAKLDYNKVLADQLKSYNRTHRNQNSVLEFAADPLNVVGPFSKVGKTSKFVTALVDAAKSRRAIKAVSTSFSKISQSKPLQWLKAEAKTPQQNLAETVLRAKAERASVQSDLLPRLAHLNAKLAGKQTDDLAILKELGQLSDREARTLQRLVSGKVSGRDRLALIGRYNAPTRERLESLGARYRALTEREAAPDNISSENRFRQGSRQYFHRGRFRRDAEGDLTANSADFRLLKKSKKLMSAEMLHASQVDRYFRSNYQEKVFAPLSKASERARVERDALRAQYDQRLNRVADAVDAAERKTKTLYGRTRGALAKYGPISIWKKSVLKYRPAWYTNNFLYNTQAAHLAGGTRALVEQARLLRPKNYRAALRELPQDVRADIASEVGSGITPVGRKISKFAGAVENISRIGAYRALRSKGLDHHVALKRVNRYLFDYKTHNWERPLKAAIPFWSFQKNLSKAAIAMPFDRPLHAQVYNRLGRYQNQQYDRDFDTTVPRLKQLGYSDADIAKLREEQRKYINGRLKIGSRYWSTPFNAFSEKGLSNLNINPFIGALGEIANSTDNFGRPLKGAQTTFGARFREKFPQVSIANKFLQAHLLKTGKLQPTSTWIGAPGSEGYGLSKQAQGYDKSKANYSAKLDPSSGAAKDFWSFLGKPSDYNFDKSKFLERKTMEKLKTEYFAMNTSKMSYANVLAKRSALFKKFGVSPDQFYKGELAKYDTQTTKGIKAQKEEARLKTEALYQAYSAQPKGTRNQWATTKLKELVDQNYFAKNPFLKSFDWVNPATIRKAYRQTVYNPYHGTTSLRSSFVYNGKSFKTAQSRDRYRRGDFWRTYFASTDRAQRARLLAAHPEFNTKRFAPRSKSAKALFWESYAAANPSARRALLVANPQYNDRKDWTSVMWDAWRTDQANAGRNAVRSKIASFSSLESRNAASNAILATVVKNKKDRARAKIKLKYLPSRV